MPRNKRPQDRAEKRDEIVVAARRLFVEDGYDATPISRLAKAAGVTANTIYWYFDDKDAVLIAVLDAVVAEGWEHYRELGELPVSGRLLWFVEQLEQTRQLVTTVHARVHVSPALNTWHEGFHRAAEAMFQDDLRGATSDPRELAAEVQIGVFAIEGMLTHELGEDEKRSICDALAARWTAAAHS